MSALVMLQCSASNLGQRQEWAVRATSQSTLSAHSCPLRRDAAKGSGTPLLPKPPTRVAGTEPPERTSGSSNTPKCSVSEMLRNAKGVAWTSRVHTARLL